MESIRCECRKCDEYMELEDYVFGSMIRRWKGVLVLIGHGKNLSSKYKWKLSCPTTELWVTKEDDNECA